MHRESENNTRKDLEDIADVEVGHGGDPIILLVQSESIFRAAWFSTPV
jgi:hypothetical protein